jgi:hypothetical protein
MEPLIVSFDTEQYFNPSKEINLKVLNIQRKSLKKTDENERDLEYLEKKIT